MGHNRKKKQTEGQAVVPEEEAARREGNGKGRFRKCYKNNIWFFRGVIISLLFAILFSCFYGVFRARAEVCEESPLETRDNITWLFQSCYLLYRDLHNVSQEELLDYTDIYLEPNEEYDWILDERQMSEYNGGIWFPGERTGELAGQCLAAGTDYRRAAGRVYCAGRFGQELAGKVPGRKQQIQSEPG